jgi:antitoxin ParD1/3/4
MGRNTSISLGSHFENFISSEIQTGKYGSVSEVIRTALRLLENEEEKLTLIRRALIEGENSGVVKGFNSDDFLKELESQTS